MNATYELTVDDLTAFTQFHYAQSPTSRKQRMGCLIGGLALMLILPGLVFMTSDKPILQTARDIWPLLLGPLLFAMLAPAYMRWKTKRVTRCLLSEGGDGLYGECSMSLDEHGICESKSSGQTNRNWSSVQRIITTSDHVFVYTSGVEAFVIPKRSFASDELLISLMETIVDRSGVEIEIG